jgi:hypothetical protein
MLAELQGHHPSQGEGTGMLEAGYYLPGIT